MTARIGARNRRVTLQGSWATRHEDSGEANEEWVDLGEAWAMVEPLRGRELASSGLRLTERPTRFVFPFSEAWADLTPKDRVIFDGVCYDLESVVRIRYGRDEFEALGVVRT
ncbi:MAG: phage head closure protein [Gemmatimonadota bacterium]